MDIMPKKKITIRQFKKELRQMVADYMYSEGCDCCEDVDAHRIHTERLAKMLNVPKYDDGSGYDFTKFMSPENK